MKYEISKIDGYKYISVRDERKNIPFVAIGDVHYGSVKCNEHLFLKTLERIQEQKAYVLLMGDMIENSSKHSVADGWAEQKMPPRQQKDEMVQMLESLKDMIVGIVRGNHEDRSKKEVDDDPMFDIARFLGIEERYFGWEFYGSIGQDRAIDTHARSYSIYGVHSKKGGKNTALELNGILRDIGGWMHSDLIVKAHGHHKGYLPDKICHVMNDRITWQNRYVQCTGHFLDRHGSYAQATPMQPCDAGAMISWFHCDAHMPRKITFADILE